MKRRNLLFLVLVIALPMLYTVLGANSNGNFVWGNSTAGCSCHGPNLSLTNITITGIPAGGYVAGNTYTLTLTVANSSPAYAAAPAQAGFDISCTNGSFTASAGTTLFGTKELVHTSPQIMVSGSATWTFTWTAPLNATDNFTNFRIAANATNGNAGTSGDQPNQDILSFDEATPTIHSVSAISGSPTNATISATVNANNASTVATVEYGLTNAYGNTINMIPNPITGNLATNVQASLGSLTANTLYHYRISAVNSAGTKVNADSTFTTGMHVAVANIQKINFNLSPNPATDVINLFFDEEIKNSSIELFSLSGQKKNVQPVRINNYEVKMDVNNLPAGTYIIHGFVNGKRLIQKVILE